MRVVHGTLSKNYRGNDILYNVVLKLYIFLFDEPKNAFEDHFLLKQNMFWMSIGCQLYNEKYNEM